MFKDALMCLRNNVMLHAAWQNEITLSYNPASIQFNSATLVTLQKVLLDKTFPIHDFSFNVCN